MNARGAFTINEFCEWSRLGRTKTYELINDEILPIIKIGGKTLIGASDAEAFLAKFRTTPGKTGNGASRSEAAE